MVLKGFETIINAALRWGAAVTSANTGHYLYFCIAKMQIKSLSLPWHKGCQITVFTIRDSFRSPAAAPFGGSAAATLL